MNVVTTNIRVPAFFYHLYNKLKNNLLFRKFAEQIQKPFGLRYNPYTQSVEVLSNEKKITALVSELRGDLCIVNNALKKISARDSTLDVERIASLLQTGLAWENGDIDEEEPENH